MAARPPHRPAVAATLPLRLLRLVAAVAAHGSASTAAATLHLSVSAVTRGVQAAEVQLGLALFERGARGMVATPAGRLLAARTQRALAELRLGPAPVLAQRGTDGQLQALLAVAAQGSEALAAQQLGLSQPAVHQSLRQLEHAARQRLFERSRRGTRLTDAGERLLLRAGRALAELRSGHDELAALHGGVPGRVTVGVLPMASEVLVPQALSRLFEAEPGIVATAVDGTYEALLRQLRHGDIDFVVGPLRGERSPPDIDEQVLYVDRLLPVVRAGHPLLATTRPPRSLRPLRRWPWVGPLPDTPARAAFERAFRAAELEPPLVQLQCNAPSIVRAVLQRGDAVALVSPLQIRAELAAGRLVLLDVPVSGTERAIGVAQRRGGLASPAARALLRELQAVVAEDGPPPSDRP